MKRGLLKEMLVIEQEIDGDVSIVVVPKGAIIEWQSDDDWEHEITDGDIEDAASYLSDKPNTRIKSFGKN